MSAMKEEGEEKRQMQKWKEILWEGGGRLLWYILKP